MDKTQILLLNIPKEGVELFKNTKFNIEDQIVKKGTELFNRCIESEPIKELLLQDWITRTSLPIGMNQEGIFFLDLTTGVRV